MLNPYIKQLLKNIYKMPGAYFGAKMFTPMYECLSGYMLCLFDHNEVSSPNLPGFQEFVAKKYNIDSPRPWYKIIMFYSITEKDAFDTFFELLSECYGEDFTK